jgi:hypothetical protein
MCFFHVCLYKNLCIYVYVRIYVCTCSNCTTLGRLLYSSASIHFMQRCICLCMYVGMWVCVYVCGGLITDAYHRQRGLNTYIESGGFIGRGSVYVVYVDL